MCCVMSYVCLCYYFRMKDDIPHKIVEYFIKHFGTKLEEIKIDFDNQKIWHGCMPWLYQKTINKNLHLENLRNLEFKWRDDHSLLFLNMCVVYV